MKPSFTFLKPFAITGLIALSHVAQAQQMFDIDSSFGQNGRKMLQTAMGNTILYDVQRQADGKIIAAGQTKNISNDLFFFRRNADGTSDNSFATNGKLSWDLSGDETVNAIALQTDGKIVACGSKTLNNVYSSVITRIDASGAVDNNFGNQGVVSFSSISGASINASSLRNVKIQPDGKILVAGIGYNSSGNRAFVQRYKTDGTLDSTFGTNGTKTFQFVSGSHNYAEDIFIQNDGKIVVLGYSSFTSYKIHIARINANGTNDATFGTNGIMTPTLTGFTSSLPSWVTVLPDGRIQAVGYAYNGSQYKIISLRTSATGQLDNTFGTNGVAQFAASTNNNYAWDAHLYSNKDLAIAVEYYNSSVTGIASILKIDSTGNPITNFGSNGFASFTTSNEGFASAMTDDNDSLILAGGMNNTPIVNYESFVLKADANGNTISNFSLATATSGVSTTFGNKLFKLPSGNIICVGTNENNDKDIVAIKMDKDGNPISGFGNNGILNLNTSSYETVKDAIYLQDGTIALISETGRVTLSFSSLGSFTSNEFYTLTVIDTNGQVINGPHDATFDATEFPRPANIAKDGNGKYVILGRSAEPVNYTLYLSRHQNNFTFDNSYGNGDGKIDITTANNGNPVTINSLTIAPDNNVLFIIGPKSPQVWKLKDDASGDISFGTNGLYALTDTVGGGVTNVLLDKGVNGYYVSYRKNGVGKILSLDFNGQLNTTFGTAIVGQCDEMKLFEMPDASLMVVTRTDSTYTIQHVLQNGTVSTSFNNNTGNIVFTPFTLKGTLLDWTVTADTSFYLYHQFKDNNNDLTYVGVSKIATKMPTTPTALKTVVYNNTLTVSPNPFINSVDINFLDGKVDATKYTYQLFDITGRMIPVQPMFTAEGKVLIQGLQHLPSGNYLLNISDLKSKSITVKLVKE